MEPITIHRYLENHKDKVLLITDPSGQWCLHNGKLTRKSKNFLGKIIWIHSYLSAKRDDTLEFHMENGNFIAFRIKDKRLSYHINNVHYKVRNRQIAWMDALLIKQLTE